MDFRHEILYLAAERARVAPYCSADSAGDARKFFPAAKALCCDTLNGSEQICPCPRIQRPVSKAVEVTYEVDNQRVQTLIGPEHVAAAAKDDKR